MKNFYVGPIKKIHATNIRCNEKKQVVYDKEITIEEDNVLFYRNFRDKLVRYDDNQPPVLEDEVHDLIAMYYNYNKEESCTFTFVDLLDLKKEEKKAPNELKKTLFKR